MKCCCELLSICDLTIFDTPHSYPNQLRTIVVNCFQFVIWRSLTHLIIRKELIKICCELLSICDLTIFDTPQMVYHVWRHVLWIAFNLWFDDLWHTDHLLYMYSDGVVNCFQFVIWRSLTHHNHLQKCHLLMLWIAFNLWFDDLWHTNYYFFIIFIYVVNCFQFVIWRSLTHLSNYYF